MPRTAAKDEEQGMSGPHPFRGGLCQRRGVPLHMRAKTPRAKPALFRMPVMLALFMRGRIGAHLPLAQSARIARAARLVRRAGRAHSELNGVGLQPTARGNHDADALVVICGIAFLRQRANGKYGNPCSRQN